MILFFHKSIIQDKSNFHNGKKEILIQKNKFKKENNKSTFFIKITKIKKSSNK